ncbi:hypothetical protein ACQR16_19130 [Bradyrhizobium oligotrophicum]|uniref:hypothetical protein n=2 Tax=Bradyrhizobium oligotrophicum TaxID=44255 RepID=UPI003EBFA234
MNGDTAKADTPRQHRPRLSYTSRIVMSAIFILILFLIVAWLALPTPTLVSDGSGDVFQIAIDQSLQRNAANFDLWYKSNMVIQCTLIFTTPLATVFASITTRDNAEEIKKWSVLLTSVTAALASVQSTFHVRENIETFIKSSADLVLLEADYFVDRAEYENAILNSEGKPLDPEIQKKLRGLHQKYMQKYMNIQTARMRAWANAGQQSLGTQETPRGTEKNIISQDKQ